MTKNRRIFLLIGRRIQGMQTVRNTMNQDELTRLLGLARKGDKDALSEFMRGLHHTFLLIAKKRLCRDPEKAKEVAQEACTVAFLKFMDSEMPKGVAPWAHAIIRNLIGGEIKKADTRDKSRYETFDDSSATHTFVSSHELDPLQKIRLEGCWHWLIKTQRRSARIVSLREFQGYKVREIALRLGMTPNGVSQALGRAYEALRNCLERYD